MAHPSSCLVNIYRTSLVFVLFSRHWGCRKNQVFRTTQQGRWSCRVILGGVLKKLSGARDGRGCEADTEVLSRGRAADSSGI